MLNVATRTYRPHRQVMIDLHGFSVEDAKIWVYEKIKLSYAEGIDNLIIITGKGNHIAKDGVRGKIFAQTQNWLEADELKFFIRKFQKNDGSYKVKLNSNPKIISNFESKKILDQVALINSVKFQGFKLIEKQAENDPKMLGILGYLFLLGEVITQDLEKGISMVMEAARKGDGFSQLTLGKMYENGISHNLRSNAKKAVYWYEQALKQEDTLISDEAKFLLDIKSQIKKGILLSDAELQSYFSFKVDQAPLDALIDAKGMESIMAAAHNGDSQMIGKLGYIFLKGIFVEKNTKKGLELLEDAALKGDGISQLILGSMYANGTKYLKSNPTKAMYWYNQAVDKEENKIGREAKFLIGCAYYLGRGAPQNDEAAIKYLESAAWDNHDLAQINLANIYANGVRFKNELKYKNDQMSTYWYLAASKSGNVNAMLKLAERFVNGSGTNQSYSNAFLWRKRAADAGDIEAQYLVGKHYEIGEGVGEDKKSAYAYHFKAFQKGHVGAQVRVGFLLIQSKKIDSQRSGINLLKKAIKNNQDADALCILAGCYKKGIPQVLEQDEEKAIEYLVKSAKLGCTPARDLCLSQFELVSSKIGAEEFLFWMADLAIEGNQEISRLILDKLRNSNRNDLIGAFEQLIDPTKVQNKSGANKTRTRKRVRQSEATLIANATHKNKTFTTKFTQANSNKNHSVEALADSMDNLKISQNHRRKRHEK